MPLAFFGDSRGRLSAGGARARAGGGGAPTRDDALGLLGRLGESGVVFFGDAVVTNGAEECIEMGVSNDEA